MRFLLGLLCFSSSLLSLVGANGVFFPLGRREDLEAAGDDRCSMEAPEWMEDDTLDSMSDYCEDVSYSGFLQP